MVLQCAQNKKRLTQVFPGLIILDFSRFLDEESL